MAIFNRVRESLKSMGLIREVFTFVDASHLVSKLTTWDDRDRAIKAGLEEFTNKTTEKIAVDKQARFACKAKMLKKIVGLQQCVHLMNLSLPTVTGVFVIEVCRRCNFNQAFAH